MAAVARKLPQDCDKYSGKKNFQLRVANERIACATQMQFQASLALFVLQFVTDSDDDDGAFDTCECTWAWTWTCGASLILTVMLISHMSCRATLCSSAEKLPLWLFVVIVESRQVCVPKLDKLLLLLPLY
jgi:hypothetical protein